MSFRRLFLLFFFLLPAGLHAQQLSPQAKTSLITVGPGNDIYTFFGHTAIWIYDPLLGVDRVYNYGTFDFRASGFYWNFLRGNLPYKLSVSPLDYPDPQYSQLEYWKSENRKVTEQELNLSPAQKQKLYQILEINALPENNTYQYRPYYDNCSTRPRDKILEAAGDSIRLDSTDVFLLGKSYRSWMNDYLAESPWSKLGLNFLLGYPIDKVTTLGESTYIPDNLFRLMEHATVRRANGTSAKLVGKTTVLFEAKPETTGFLWKAVFWIVMASPLVYVILRKKSLRAGGAFDRFLLALTGVIGVIQLLLWFGTKHGITDLNYSLFVFNPGNIVALALLKRRLKWVSYYFIAAMVFLVVGLMIYIILWQGTCGLVFLMITLFGRYRVLASRKHYGIQ